MASGGDTLANALLTSLVAGKSFTVPNIDTSDPLFSQPDQGGDIHLPVTKLTNADLTTGTVGGTGVFDALMNGLKIHLKEEYTANRISGAEYTKAYQAAVAAALQTSAQFLLGRDQSYWAALLVQQQAQLAEIEKTTARINLETARVKHAQTKYEASTAEANYALTKLKLATEDVTFGNLEKQGRVIDAQKTGVDHDNAGKAFTGSFILPRQRDLLQEQVEVQRAQTLNTRSDGQLVVGLLGKQKDLYSQQITSYKRDAETKAVKIWTDAWITQKTIDEGLLAPTQFKNTNVNKMLDRLKKEVGF